MRSFRPFLLPVLVLLGVIAVQGIGSTPAAGTVIVFDDLAETVSLTVDGVACPPGPCSPQVGELAVYSATFTPGLFGSGVQASEATVHLTEPIADPDALSAVSDVIRATVNRFASVITIEFASDPDTLPTIGNVTSLPETGTFQDITSQFDFGDSTDLGAKGFQILVRSDVSAVPEPAALILCGTGILGLAFQVQRRRAKRT